MPQPANTDSQFNSFSDAAQRVLAAARDAAQSHGCRYLGQEHLLLGLLSHPCAGRQVIERCGADLTQLRADIESSVMCGDASPGAPTPLTMRARRALELASDEAQLGRSATVRTTHLVIGIVREVKGIGAHVLERRGVTVAGLREAASQLPTMQDD